MSLDRLGPLHDQLRTLEQGAHVCMLYESAEEQLRGIVPFVHQGIMRGERCAYIVDDRTADDVLGALESGGVEVAGAIDRGALAILTKRDSYLRSGVAEPADMVEFLRDRMEDALRAGFSGFRVAGEMTWALGPEPATERLLEYEALLNSFFPGSHALAICQYNAERFPAEIVRDVLRAHPRAVIGEEVYDNIFYEPPEILLGQESAEGRVAWMRARLERLRAAERKLALLGDCALAVENARLYQQAQQAIAARDEFMSIASHELKTPLTPLHIQVKLLSRRAGEIARPDKQALLAKRLGIIERQYRRLCELVDTLLDVSRITSGRIRLDLEDVDLSAVVRQVVAGLDDDTELASARDALQLDLDDVVVGRWDRLRLEEIVGNLVTNAIKYGAGGPVTVRAQGTPREGIVEVRDRGIGIAREDLHRIFGRFERAVSARNVSGLGVGLFIARHFAEALGGTIEVASEPGRGATFTVTLPRSGPTSKPALRCVTPSNAGRNSDER